MQLLLPINWLVSTLVYYKCIVYYILIYSWTSPSFSIINQVLKLYLRTTRSTSKQVDYKALHQGSDQPLTLGSTEFSAHLASSHHSKTDYEFSILCTDDNWFNRGMKEAIAIRKLKPTLNQDDGRHHLSRMYDTLINSSVTMRTPRQGTESVSQSQTDEGTRPGVERPL